MLLLVLYLLHFITASCFSSSNLQVNGSQGGVEAQVPSNFKRTQLNAALAGRTAGEVHVLLDFKSRLNHNSTTKLADWSAENGHKMCNWTGIACDPSKHHVVSMQLSGLWLEGTITPMLGELKHLQLLDLSWNSFHGSIPDSLGELHNLRKLDLSWNEPYLNGSIPASLGNCTLLEELNLSRNDLSGHIPETLSKLSMLRKLVLFINRINGSIPEWIPQLHQLEELDLTGNEFTGPLISKLPASLRVLHLSRNNLQSVMPSSLFLNCTLLEKVDLSDNGLTGNFPKLFQALSNLTDLDLSNNNLTGGLPNPTLFPRLEELHLSYNSFSGSIPDNWSSTLMEIDLSWNKLSGTIPTNWSSSLFNLDLSHNELSGTIPTNWTNSLDLLLDLNLSHNELSGTIPTSWSTTLEFDLDLSHNQLSGQIPFGICSTTLDFSNNQLSGSVPGNCSELESLRLSSNLLSGSVPSSLGNSSSLRILDLSNNNLEGEIFKDVALAGLQILDVTSNRFTGNIVLGSYHSPSLMFVTINLGHNNFSGSFPLGLCNITGRHSKQALTFLSLASNNLQGSIPSCITNLTNVQVLDLSSNHFTGPIPHNLQRLAALKNGWVSLSGLDILAFTEDENGVNYDTEGGSISQIYHGFNISKDGHRVTYKGVLYDMAVLDLSNNNLEGEIPVTMGQLYAMKFLNLSHNNLSGTIPRELGNISKLLSLDLSYNHLQGPIPPSIASIDLSSFSVANNNLSGLIPTGNGFNSRFDASSFEGNAGLHGCPLQPCPWGRRPDPPKQQPHTDEDEKQQKGLFVHISAWSFFGAALIAFCVTFSITLFSNPLRLRVLR